MKILAFSLNMGKYRKEKYAEYQYFSRSLDSFSVPIDVINLCGKIRIWKSRHYGGQAM